MSAADERSGRHLLDGTVWVFLTNLLLPLTGLVTAAYLTRRLQADGYGLLVLSTTVYMIVDLTVSAFLSRASIKFVGEASDWRPVGETVLRLYTIVGVAAGIGLALCAYPLALLLAEPELTICLLLYALQVPVSTLSLGHQNILVGTARFRQRAVANAARWIARLVLILALVAAGLSVPGAILGSVGAAVVELGLSRLYVKVPIFGRFRVPVRPFFEIGIVLGVFSLLVQLFSNLGVIFLKTLGGSIEQVGQYGAAQNLSIIPALLGISLSPLLLSTMSAHLAQGKLDEAQSMAREAVRATLCLLPFGGVVAGAAGEIVTWIFGSSFSAAAPILAILFFGAIVFILISIAAGVATAAGIPRAVLPVSFLLVVTGVIANVVLIPRFGAEGAAAATTLCQTVAAVASVYVIHRIWPFSPPVITLVRSLAVGVGAYWAAASWPVEGIAVVPKLAVLALAVPLALALLGEFSREELALVRAMLWPKER